MPSKYTEVADYFPWTSVHFTRGRISPVLQVGLDVDVSCMPGSSRSVNEVVAGIAEDEGGPSPVNDSITSAPS